MSRKRLFGSVLGVLLLWWAWSLWMLPDSHIVLTPADFDRLPSKQDVSEDLEFLPRTIEQVHLDPYHNLSADEFRRDLSRIEAGIDQPMTRRGLFVELAPAVARLNDGHTNVKILVQEINYLVQQGEKWFPLSITVAESGVLIKADLAVDPAIEAGSELAAINGIAAGEIVTNLTRYVSSESPSHRVEIVETRLPFYLRLVYGFEDSFEVTIRSRGTDETTTRKIDGLTWRAIKQTQTESPAKQPDGPFWFAPDSGSKTGLLTVDQFIDQDRFSDFLEETFATVRSEGIEHLIIDLRANGGGSTDVSNELLRYLASEPVRNYAKFDLKVSRQIKEQFRSEIPKPIRMLPVQYLVEQGRKVWSAEEGSIVTIEGKYLDPLNSSRRFDGRVYLLIGPQTFSTAADVAAVIKDFSLGTLIGEETGGMACSYGDTYLFRLPNSLLQVGISYKYFVRPSGKITRQGIRPDHQVTQTAADEASGIDPVLEFTRALIARERPESR